MYIVYDEIYLKHKQGDAMHPEAPYRLSAIIEELRKNQLFTNVFKPYEATEEDLLAVHKDSYIKLIKELRGYYDSDTYVSENTYLVAKYAVGGALNAVELSLEYQKPAIALVRPPGHHASVASAGGFCYFNNIAICASKFSKQYRVAIVDIDVHHGNGTAEIFYDKPLLYISTHHYGIYPGTGSLKEIGEKEGRGCTVNIPFFMGCGDASYSLACEKSLNTKY